MNARANRAFRRSGRIRGCLAAALLAGAVGAGPFAPAVSPSPSPSAEPGGRLRPHRTGADPPGWVERRRDALPDPNSAGAAAARFELAEEIAALRGGSLQTPLDAGDRRALLELLAEAIELDEAWTAPALRLAAHAEDDARRRGRIERMLHGVAGDRAASASVRDRLEASRLRAAYLRGRVEAAADARRRFGGEDPLADPWLEEALDGGGDRIRRDLDTGTAPLLRPEERRRLLELDLARLGPESATFAASAWLDGWAPLPEVDARSIASWLRSLGR